MNPLAFAAIALMGWLAAVGIVSFLYSHWVG